MHNVNNTNQHEKNVSMGQTITNDNLYKNIIETSMDGFGMIDIDGNILEVNEAYRKLVGYTHDELLSMNIAEIDVQKTPEEIKQHIKYINKYGSHKFTTKHKGKNGEIIEFEVSANSIKHKQATSFAFFRDITEHNQIKKDIISAKRDWENIFQAIGQPSVILNSERKIIAANRAAVSMTGKTVQQLIGKKCYEIFHLKNAPPEGCPFNFENIKTSEMEIETLEGTFLVSCTPLFNEQGKPDRIIHIATDITKRKKTEKKLEEYQKKLKQMTTEILFAEEHERHRIAAGIHDDVGQRLAIVKYGLDSLKASESRQEVLSVLKKQGELITNAIEDVRSFTFELSNPILYEIGIEAAIETWLIEHIQNKCGIKCSFFSNGPKLNLPLQTKIILFQGVRELLTNIVKHAQADNVSVNIIRNYDSMQINIKDNGIGFSLSAADKQEKEKKGFGIFNLREKLEYLGGRLEIENASPKGTFAAIYILVENN